jgi:hypothetical protein
MVSYIAFKRRVIWPIEGWHLSPYGNNEVSPYRLSFEGTGEVRVFLSNCSCAIRVLNSTKPKRMASATVQLLSESTWHKEFPYHPRKQKFDKLSGLSLCPLALHKGVKIIKKSEGDGCLWTKKRST